MQRDTEKLEAFNKILLATSTINYMASQLNGVMLDFVYAGIPQYKEHEDFLLEKVKELTQIMEDIGDYLNGGDMVENIDQAVTTPAFEILVHGKDSVDQYDEDQD